MIKELIDTLFEFQNLPDGDLLYILDNMDANTFDYLSRKADEKRRQFYDNQIYMRGLIEFTNFCKQDCAYCGLRKSNTKITRYRMKLEQILDCCEKGYDLGFRTFVLQGGEDPWFNDDRLEEYVRTIKNKFPEVALTLSVGERSRESYKRLYDAGVNRYLLRHETASPSLYESLHVGMSLENRKRCLQDLKEIGYQVGAGFMVGLPGQTHEDLVMDLRFLYELKPHMIGIGPFIPHSDTPLANATKNTIDLSLTMISLTRLMVPDALLPATTAMGTLDRYGRERAIKAGANIVMPNLSPIDAKQNYEIYQNKICVNDDVTHCRGCIEMRIKNIGYEVNMSRGDHYEFNKSNQQY